MHPFIVVCLQAFALVAGIIFFAREFTALVVEQPLYAVLFAVSCYCAALSEKLLFKKQKIQDEILSQLHLDRPSLTRPEFFVLILFASLGAFGWIVDPGLGGSLLIGSAAISIIFLSGRRRRGLYALRYLLEMPKLLLGAVIAFGGVNPWALLVLLAIGSIYYKIIPRAAGVLEALILSIFLLEGSGFRAIIYFIFLIRVIGFWVLLPVALMKKKYFKS